MTRLDTTPLVPVLLLLWIGLVSPVHGSSDTEPDNGLAYTFVDTSSRVVLEGSSTVVNWSCESSSVDGFVTFPVRARKIAPIREALVAGETESLNRIMADALFGRPRGLFWIPVRSFQCDNKRMTRDMYQALKADEHEIIVYQHNRLNALTFPGESTERNLKFQLDLTGGLAMAGSANSVSHRTTVLEREGGVLVLSGEFPVHMTDFGVDPPRALMGLIEAHDRVTVRYEIEARPVENPRKADRAIRDKIDEFGKLLRPARPK